MKRVLCALVVLLLLAMGMSACFAEDVHDLVVAGKLVGTLTNPNRRDMNDPEFVDFDSFDALLMALNAGKVDRILVPDFTSRYLNKTQPGKYVSEDVIVSGESLGIDMCMGVLEENSELLNRLNEAISGMKADGTLDGLYAAWMDSESTPEDAIELPRFEGAETLRVLVTGDVPPMDFVAADGKPEGYNVAMLAELAGRMQVNLELITANTASRTAALKSGRADIVFWMRSFYTATDEATFFTEHPEGVAVTDSYLTCSDSLLMLKDVE